MLNHETIERLSTALRLHESLIKMRDVSLQNSGQQFVLCVKSALPNNSCVHNSVNLSNTDSRAVLDTAITRSTLLLNQIVDELKFREKQFILTN